MWLATKKSLGSNMFKAKAGIGRDMEKAGKKKNRTVLMNIVSERPYSDVCHRGFAYTVLKLFKDLECAL